MATVSKPFTFSAGAIIVAAQHNSNFDTLYNDYNGNITNANIASAAAIADTKLAQITSTSKVSFTALTAASQAQGDVAYFNGTNWVRLGAGTAGQALTTAGAAANPTFAGMTTQGDIEYHNGTTRTRLAPGTAGQALTTGGAGANPAHAGMTTQGDVEYHNGTTRTRLAAGTSGQFLKTQGAGANPTWASLVSLSSGFISAKHAPSTASTTYADFIIANATDGTNSKLVKVYKSGQTLMDVWIYLGTASTTDTNSRCRASLAAANSADATNVNVNDAWAQIVNGMDISGVADGWQNLVVSYKVIGGGAVTFDLKGVAYVLR